MKGAVRISYYVELTEVLEVEDPKKLEKLSNDYVWSVEHVLNYFKDERASSPLYKPFT